MVFSTRGHWWVAMAVMGLMVLAYPLHGLSLTGDLTNDPAKVVEKYLSLDKRGARLYASSYDVLFPFVDWHEEPVWGHVVVISDYHVIEDVSQWQILNSLETFIPVTFHILGTMQWEAATFLPDKETRLEHFHVKEVGNRWRIIGPLLPPHVGMSRLINFVRQAQLDGPTETRKAALFNLQKTLEQARQ